MAHLEVTVPDLGGIDEVEVIEISIKPGSDVEAEDALIVVESDKATMEVPAPASGKVLEFLVAVGDKVSTGSVVAKMETEHTATASANVEPVQEVAASQPVQTPETNAQKEAASVLAEQEIDVLVPDLGTSDKVEIIEICAQAGDSLEMEASILVLESDKATMEVPVTQAGTVLSILVAVGDKVGEGDLIARMKVQVNAQQSAHTQSPPVEPPSTQATAKSISEPATAKVPAVQSLQNESDGERVHAGPAVRKLARELGVELAKVVGSGPRKRIVKDDVRAYVKQIIQQGPVAAHNPLVIKGSDEDFSKHGAISSQALNKIKMLTAKSMVASWTTIPQVTQFDEADITELEAYRKNQMAAMLPSGVKVSPLAFITKALVKALQAYPQFNASLGPNGDTLIIKEYFNIGIAVDTPEGLLVPVIKGADTKGVIELATASSELAQKARDKKLSMDAMTGGSFTISSLGGIGGIGFTPIVTAPQVAILGVSKASMKPVWNGSSFEPRLMLPLSVSYDHRVIDGAEAARFTRYLCELLSDVRHLLL